MVRKLIIFFFIVVGCSEKKQDLFLDCNEINPNGSLSNEIKRLSIEYNKQGKRLFTFYFRSPYLEGEGLSFNETKDTIEVKRPGSLTVIDRFTSDVTFSYEDAGYFWDTSSKINIEKKVLKFKCKKVERQF